MILLERSGLVAARVIRRYQRFLADMELEDGRRVTAHTTNTGTMKTCWEPGDRTLLQPASNPARKLPYTWLAVEREGTWIGVETGIPNRVVAEAARRDRLPGLPGLSDVRTEVRYGREGSRIDVLATGVDGAPVYIEVKNTTLQVGDLACFPDAVSQRGLKHLRELQAMVREGHHAAIAFFIHRGDVQAFDAAREVDPAYADELDRAAAIGVRVLPLQARLQATRLGPEPGASWRLDWWLDDLLPWIRS